MNVNIIVSDYLLVWNILFTKSIIEQLKDTKQKLWDTYRNEYNNSYYEKDLILKDYKNFIPNNDTVYNAIIEKEEFKLLKRNTEKVRVNTIKIWDKNNKKINKFFKDVVRKQLPDLNIFVLNKEFNYLEVTKLTKEESACVIGKKYQDDRILLVDVINEVLKKEIKPKTKSSEIKEVLIELAVINEFATMLDNKSHYKDGLKKYQYLKMQIYPYWLMFLGIKKEDMLSYMQRDGIKFDINRITYSEELKNLNIEEFIEYIENNKKNIIKINKLSISDED